MGAAWCGCMHSSAVQLRELRSVGFRRTIRCARSGRSWTRHWRCCRHFCRAVRQDSAAVDRTGEAHAGAVVASLLFGALGAAADGTARLEPAVLLVCRAGDGRIGLGRDGSRRTVSSCWRVMSPPLDDRSAGTAARQSASIDEDFSVDGTPIEAWASMKSFRPKDGSGAAGSGAQCRALLS
jgi:hypothetical protein